MALGAAAQRHKIEDVNAEKPDGKLLQQIMQESDVAKRSALLEQFASEFPKHNDLPWVLEQLQTVYVKSGDADKTLAWGEKLLALDPGDPEAGMQCLKAAENKKDTALIKKYAASTSAAARKMAATPQPKEADEVAPWKASVEYAKQVDAYTDYALYRAAAESRDPKLTIEMYDSLVQQSPNSEYVPKLAQITFIAYRQTGDNAKALTVAEQTLATDQSNEDMLLVVTDNYAQQKKEPEKIHAYSAKIVDIMAQKPKPEGMSDADWTARKNLVTGLAHYMNGKLYHTENNFAKADVELRAALPLVEASPAIAATKPEVLYLLALSNFKLEKPQEAANYFRACAAIKSPFQQLATTNLARVKSQYTGIK
jgi:tetratricopeptide (TPR) repeat protein